MLLKTSTLELKKNTKIISRILEKKVGVQQSEIIFIKAENNKLTIRTTNFETGVEVVLDSKTEGSWNCCISGAVFEGVVSSLEGEQTTIAYEKNLITISSENNISSIQVIDLGEEYPEIPKIDGKTSEISTEDITSGLKSVVHAVAKNITKIEFTGVYCFSEEDTITFVATDARRLAERIVNTGKSKHDLNFILAEKQARSAIKIFESMEDRKIKIIQGNEGMVIMGDNLLFYTKTIKGDFPDYRNLVPKKIDTSVIVSKYNILNFLKKAKLFSSDSGSIELSIEDSNLFLRVKNESVGETEEKITSVKVDGSDIKIFFNQDLIRDAISVIDDENILIEFNSNPNVPMKLHSKGDVGYTSLIMPLIK